MSIPEWAKKINTGVMAVICLVLIATFAIGLAQIRDISAQKQPILVRNDGVVEAKRGESAPTSSLQVVASKTGSKYHLLDCPGAKTIAEKNKVYFASAKDAENAGYSRAANCKGLSLPASVR